MWRPLGLALRLNPSVLARIEKERPSDVRACLSEMVTEWLNQSYNTERFGVPSWKMLVEAVAHPNGGNNHALAQKIAAIHTGKCCATYNAATSGFGSVACLVGFPCAF